MRVLGKDKIEDFIRRHAETRSSLYLWVDRVEEVSWTKSTDIRNMYGSASFLGDRRVIFNIKGPKYRMDVLIDYEGQQVLVVRIGTHAEYDKWKF